MITSDLDHLERQVRVTPAFKKAIDFLRQSGLRDMADGKVEIDGERVFAIIQRYETITAEEPKFEYHRKYIDVQFMASGEEIIGWAPADRMTIIEAYVHDKDIAFGTVPPGQWTPVFLKAGQAAVLFPEDGHAPKLAAGNPTPVMKVVVKVAV